jgi:protein involved in polysaccharide export with SLBB domain
VLQQQFHLRYFLSRRTAAPGSILGLILRMLLGVSIRRCLLSGALLALPRVVVAQVSSPADTTSESVAGEARRASSVAGEAQRPSRSDAPLLGAPVQADRYVLGPGDRLDISMFGALNRIVPVDVSPGGELVIPGIGIVSVGGLTITEAERRVRATVLKLYQNVGVHLTLASVRQFKVYVIGDVPSPGVRVASAATRVSEVVPVLEAPSIQPGEVEEAYLHRNILVRRGAGDSIPVDLVRFQLAGRLDSNPMLREGDVVVVPVVNERVYVYGRVSYPGAFEFRSGESLADLLSVANGGGGLAPDASDTIRVSRSTGPLNQEQFSFTRKEAVGPRGKSFVLQPLDAIYVPRNNNREPPQVATVTGQLLRPGAYPISSSTTIRDLVAMAGGFLPDASLRTATLRRQTPSSDSLRLGGLKNMPPDLLSSRERRVLLASQQGSEGEVVINFQELFLNGVDVYNQRLQPGDSLIVPKRRDEVTILGAVPRPGLVQFTPGRPPEHFIDLAGGYTGQAGRGDVVVVRANSAVRLDADEVESVGPGDAIIVPYKERRDYLRIFQTTSSVVTTLAGLVLTFMAFNR